MCGNCSGFQTRQKLKKPTLSGPVFDLLAEREGFEPPVLLQTTVFKTAAFDRSAISPERAKVQKGGIPAQWELKIFKK